MVRKIKFDNDKVVTYSNQSHCDCCNNNNCKDDISLKYDVDIMITDIERLNDALEELQSDFDDLSSTVETLRCDIAGNYDSIDELQDKICLLNGNDFDDEFFECMKSIESKLDKLCKFLLV